MEIVSIKQQQKKQPKETKHLLQTGICIPGRQRERSEKLSFPPAASAAAACSIVYKDFLAQLTRCSEQPNYRVKPWLKSSQSSAHPASISEPQRASSRLSTRRHLHPWLCSGSGCIPTARSRRLTRNEGCNRGEKKVGSKKTETVGVTSRAVSLKAAEAFVYVETSI